MERLAKMLGREHGLDEIALALRYQVESLHASAVGAMQITCADESEWATVEAFQKHFVEHLLPELKTWSRSPFRCANLGGRYEWGALRIAEQHFALRETAENYKIIVAKINSHVSAISLHAGLTFGPMERYNVRSNACGALHALVDGGPLPFTHELKETFSSEGADRLAMLRDVERIDPAERMLFAAIVNARLQARQAMLDVQDYQPVTPTVYIILAGVTLNRPGDDTELPVGYYVADARQDDETFVYHGLGDDPTGYRMQARGSRVQVEDDHLHVPRPARNHRRLVADHWERKQNDFGPLVPAAPGDASPEMHIQHERLYQMMADAEAGKHHDARYTKPMVCMLLGVLAEISPIPAALILFAEGFGSIYHTHRAHRLARKLEGQEDARLVLDEIMARVDELPHERAKRVIEILVDHYRK